MDFLKKDFDHLQQNDEDYKDNFEDSYTPCLRYTLLYHTLQYLFHVHKELDNVPNPEMGIGVKNLKQVRPGDTTVVIGKEMAEKYQELINERNQKPIDERGILDDGDIFSLVIRTFKRQIIKTVILFHIDGLFRIAFSVLILHLFEDVVAGNKTGAYIWVAILTVIWYISQLFKELGLNASYLLASRIKAGISMLAYAKMSQLSPFILNAQRMGWISNLVANDLTVIEQRTPILLHAMVFPFMFIGIGIVLFIRIGWPSLIGMLLILLSIPLIWKISFQNGEIVKQVNPRKDKRVQSCNQIIDGSKYIKQYGWESPFLNLIKMLRADQLSHFRKLAFGRAVERAVGNGIPFIAAIVMFVISHYATSLTVPKILSVMEMLAILKITVLYVVLGLGLYYESKVVFNRFAQGFNLQQNRMVKLSIEGQDDTDENNPSPNPPQQSNQRLNSIQFLYQGIEKVPGKSALIYNKLLKHGQIRFIDFNGYWIKDIKKDPRIAAVKDITFNFQPRKLYGITGKVGSGKSSLLAAILGELPYYSGKIELNGSIAFVEQEPVVFSDTIRGNILFGKEFDRTKYEKAIRMACLGTDIGQLPEKDLTQVGDKGLTLSGGEKARIALARSVYADADIYIFDNPLAAVDTRVTKKILVSCFKKLGRQKTVILVTHKLSQLNECGQILILEDGKIINRGPPNELFYKLNEELGSSMRGTSSKNLQGSMSKIMSEDDIEMQSQLFSFKEMRPEQIEQSEQVQFLEAPTDDKNALLYNEKTTRVSCSTYGRFFFADKLNYLLWPIILIIFIGSEVVVLAFLRLLTDYQNVQTGVSGRFGGDFGLYWGILSLLIGIHMISLMLKYFLTNLTITLSSTKIHQAMIRFFLHCPVSFFNASPTGIFINKFTTDLGVLDNSLVVSFIDAIEGPILIIVAMFNMIEIDPYFAIPAGILAIIVIAFFIYSRPAFLACKQLDLQRKSPIFNIYNQTISGLIQLRLYGRRKQKIRQFSQIMNKSVKAAIGFDMVSRGFGFYQTIASILLMTAGMYLGIEVIDHTNVGHYGVAVIYLIAICEILQFILRQIISVESYLVSAQRILQFQDFGLEKQLRTDYDKEVGLKEEVDAEGNDDKVHLDWPQKPQFQVKGLSARYQNDLPIVLKNISFNIRRKQKVALVGRSGSGKTTIINSLLRIIQPEQGCTYRFGDFNALELGLHSLRRHISIIPQNSFILTGTVRMNIDLFGLASDQQLWKALEDSNLKEIVEALPKKLDTQITNNSEVFTIGQKQLVCLARVLIQNNRVIILDEATASLDMKTDTFIQEVIRSRFKDCTILTVAHRLNTIADYDWVIVIQKGEVKQQGDPIELIKQRGGPFYDLVKFSGKHESQQIISSARDLFKSK